MHVDEPPTAKVPMRHEEQLVNPDVPVTVPAAQAVQTVAPDDAPYLPAGLRGCVSGWEAMGKKG